jgi:hypothetical protein
MLLATSCSPDPSSAIEGGASDDAASDNTVLCLTCIDAQSDASLFQKVEGVLGSICANPDGCHASGDPKVPFMLSGGSTDFAQLIDARSFERPELVRVKPGDPAASYLYLKLLCDGGIDGSCMPPGPPQPSLITLFHDWIEAGAPTQ